MGDPDALPWPQGLAPPWGGPAAAGRIQDAVPAPVAHDLGPCSTAAGCDRGGDYRRRLRLKQLSDRVERARCSTTAWDVEWRWRQWFSAGPVQRLLAAVKDLRCQGVTEAAVMEQGLGRGPRPVTYASWQRVRLQLQSSAATLLRRRQWLRSGFNQLDKKVRKWRAPALLPGRRARRCCQVMRSSRSRHVRECGRQCCEPG